MMVIFRVDCGLHHDLVGFSAENIIDAYDICKQKYADEPKKTVILKKFYKGRYENI